jgi:membrane protease YdiL (CAAX protease family)
MTSHTLSTPVHRPPNTGSPPGPTPTQTSAQPRQLTKGGILAVWAAAALPMGLLMWVVGPALSHHMHGPQALTRALILCIAAGLVWQFVLVVALVGREQRTLRWSTIREVLWLRAPRSPRTGRTGGRLWLIIIPLIVGVAAEEMIPSLPHSANHDLATILQSSTGQHFLVGSWMWFAVLVVMFVFNTVLGEELLFRGYLLPRMNDAFGKRDWVANGVLFAAYHLHRPWIIPNALCDMFFLAYPSKRFRSAWLGIAVHSVQTVVFTVVALTVVLK